MESLENIYRINKERLHSLSIPFREWRHEAILDFDTDLKVAKELGWQGTHSKSLFLAGMPCSLLIKTLALMPTRLKQY